MCVQKSINSVIYFDTLLSGLGSLEYVFALNTFSQTRFATQSALKLPLQNASRGEMPEHAEKSLKKNFSEVVEVGNETIHRKTWLGSPKSFWLAGLSVCTRFVVCLCPINIELDTGQANTIKIKLIDW